MNAENDAGWYATHVSMVQSASETKTCTVELRTVLKGIRNGKWRCPVERVKAKYISAFEAAKKQGDPRPYETAKEAVSEIKKKLPGVLFSGEFSQRANERIINHSGLLCLDLDHIENGSSLKPALASDAHVQAFFVSPTGSGLKVLLRIEPNKDSHERSFAAAAKYFREQYHAKVDKCKDIARLCFVSYDANIFVRDKDAALLTPLPLEPKPQTTPPPPVPRDIDAELTAKCGPAYCVTDKGTLLVNQNYFVQRICVENLVFFEHDEKRFFIYKPSNGAWEAVPTGAVKELIRNEWERYTKLFAEPGLALKINAVLISALAAGVESHSGRNRVFKRLEKIIHCANGMLHIDADGRCTLMPFSPAYYSRNPVAISWEPDAICPKFDALLEFALPPEAEGLASSDVDFFWRWFGSVLLTGNTAHRILLMVGKAASGKNTIAEVVELVLGLVNCTEVRTKWLHERFEIGRLSGFSLLSAKDVPGDFFEETGAQALKKLTGHDHLDGEVKGSMISVKVYGDFGCMVTCNERMLIQLQGDTDIEAWRRRLAMLVFENVIPPEKRTPNYAQVVFAEEGPGVLRKAVAGAIVHLAELKESGNFKETKTQQGRIDHLLAESESIKYFVTERICGVSGGVGLSTEELVTAYIDYCADRQWRPYGIKQVERKLPDLMMSIHGVHVGANVIRNKKRVRGYPNVAFKVTP
jgi:hypothetical protein